VLATLIFFLDRVHVSHCSMDDAILLACFVSHALSLAVLFHVFPLLFLGMYCGFSGLSEEYATWSIVRAV
jgi:hypothetical protein